MVNLHNSIAKSIYRKIFPDYPKELEKAVGGCKTASAKADAYRRPNAAYTLLDVGCGENSPVRHFSNKPYCVGVDAFEPSIRKSKAEGIHDRYYKMDILEIGRKFKPNSFDCVLASDAIEHLTKEEGLRLLAMMEKIAREKVIVFTPNGFLPQGEFESNPWQLHKSGWNAEEMKRLGYKVTGINGWKPLRGAYAAIRLKPKFAWSLLSDLTQLFTGNHPEYAFQLLCVKETLAKNAKKEIKLNGRKKKTENSDKNG
ncbi:class I SAM-dependent methyltransferase [Candidatus Woesearchaeota archaeon]|nr:class I SAM-dependent methyltransferase [Candidatus Woesearchaeota archaeon]